MAELVFGTQLAKLRKEKGVTQEQIADYLGVSPQAISKWENGSYPNGDLLPRLADYFGVSIDYLYGREKKEVSLEQQILEAIQSASEDGEWDYEARFEQMFRFIWAMQAACWIDNKYYYERNHGDRKSITASAITNKSGFSYMRLNKDLEFYALMKEPEGGFSSYFKVTDRLEELFALLGKKENLQVLFYILSLENAECVSAATIAKQLKLSEKCVEELLEHLRSFTDKGGNGMLLEAKLVDEYGGRKKVYAKQEVSSAPILLLLAAADVIINPPQSYALQIASRGKGWLERGGDESAKA